MTYFGLSEKKIWYGKRHERTDESWGEGVIEANDDEIRKWKKKNEERRNNCGNECN